jgi:RluA family pseudouridine synthase
MATGPIRITVDTQDEGVRLDRLLRKRLSGVSLSAIYRMIRTGRVRVNGTTKRQNYRLAVNDEIDIPAIETEENAAGRSRKRRSTSVAAAPFFERNFIRLYEDEYLLVCDKPAGLVVHPGTGHLRHDTLVDLAAAYMQSTGKKENAPEPTLVHRLDRDTSGVILLAKDRRLLRHLHTALREHSMEKRYVALCHGHLPSSSGSIQLGLQRTHQRNRGTKVRISKQGQAAATSYRVTGETPGYAQLELELHTGRTHQIRVHLAHLGNPVIGDVRYGDVEKDRAFFHKARIEPRLMLHAHQLTFYHPFLERSVTFTAPVPEVFRKLTAVMPAVHRKRTRRRK